MNNDKREKKVIVVYICFMDSCSHNSGAEVFMWTKTTPLLSKNGKKKQVELEAKSPERERGVASSTVKNCTNQQNDLLDTYYFY